MMYDTTRIRPHDLLRDHARSVSVDRSQKRSSGSKLQRLGSASACFTHQRQQTLSGGRMTAGGVGVAADHHTKSEKSCLATAGASVV
jgi:phage baseplate assembly protein gpV